MLSEEVTALDSCSYWEQGLRTLAGGLRVEELSDKETCSTQMIGGSLTSWSLLWSLVIVVIVVVLLSLGSLVQGLAR